MTTFSSELLFAKKYIENMSIPFHVVDLFNDPEAIRSIKIGPHSLVLTAEQLNDYVGFIRNRFIPNTIFRITDEFLCRYFVFSLHKDASELIIIGPYLNAAVTEAQIRTLYAGNEVASAQMERLKEYYNHRTLVEDDAPLLVLMNTLGESLWGSLGNFMMRDINHHLYTSFEQSETRTATENDTSLAKMNNLSDRYHAENLLLEAISKGELHKAEMLFLNFISLQRTEVRTSDIVRNAKNYCIILNTLFRKAAEQGKVHPIHLDRTSSGIASRIENARTVDEINSLGKEMVRKYCLLVRNHSMSNYSVLIQQALTYINGDLTVELTLGNIAEELHVNASYLSSQFKKELGVTLTDYVTQKRINHAIFLINSSSLQISSVAQKCGIPDVQYFSKLFKKHLGMSPLQYRKMISGGS